MLGMLAYFGSHPYVLGVNMVWCTEQDTVQSMTDSESAPGSESSQSTRVQCHISSR